MCGQTLAHAVQCIVVDVTPHDKGVLSLELSLPHPRLTKAQARLLGPLQLAYIGDTVFDLFVRTHLVLARGGRMNALHRLSASIVCAGAQARMLEALLPELDDEERDIVRWGRNAKSGTIPHGAEPREYRQATALEALLGYLFVCGRNERLGEIMRRVIALHGESEYGEG